MRARAVAQFALGLRQGDVEAFLAGLGAFEQELQRHRGFAGAGGAFGEKDMAARKSTRQDVVEAPDAGFRLFGKSFDRVHMTP